MWKNSYLHNEGKTSSVHLEKEKNILLEFPINQSGPLELGKHW